MDNYYHLMDRIENDHEYRKSEEKLRMIYKEIMRLIVKKEEYEKMIEEYLERKST